MKFIIKPAPEITIKSKPVRKRFIQQLRQNIRNVLKKIDPDVVVSGVWDNLYAETAQTEPALWVDALACLPGIAHSLMVETFELGSVDDIYRKALNVYREELKGKTFAVRVKRVGNHDFTSLDVERYVGGGLNQHTESAGVKLNQPDTVIKIEIRHQELHLITRKIKGLGGFPLGAQDTTLTLISGGFDSGVAYYQVIKRGMRSHFLFFNLGGTEHEKGVKEVSRYLWEKFGSSHRVRFVTVPFEGVVEEILTQVDNAYMGVTLKRMMYRAADRIAAKLNLDTFVTGEAIAQVSSQTVPNLRLIEKVTDRMVVRPLVVTDKQDIIDLSRKIGTAAYAESMPEYCGVISRKPTTRAKEDRLLAEEAKFDMQVLDLALEQARVEAIDDVGLPVAEDSVAVSLPELTLAELSAEDTLLDIRHPDEISRLPLKDKGDCAVQEMPFYQLQSHFHELPDGKRYVLYCDRGVMSRMQALHLLEKGFTNVAWLKAGEK